MAKKSKYDLLHEQRVNEITKKIDDIYAAAVTEAASIGAIVRGFNPDKVFAFSDYPVTRERVNAMLKQLHNQVVGVVENGCRAEWDLANEKNDELTERLLGPYRETMPKEVLERYYRNNNDAREQFIRRREEVRGETEGLNLSDRVWRYTDQFKQEIELGLDLGLGEGRSADQMSRDLRGYLREPNKLFRRVRDKHGNLVLSKAAKAYHPGRGVYRSSYKNARRLAATETNIAYRSADHIRWNQLDFVVGIRINLSKNHTINGVPFTDICDDLQGLYPKTFKFTGWHPLCRCYPTSVLKTEDELFRDLDGVDRGSENKVEKTPKAFDEYVKKNRDRIAGSASKPYWVLDNFKDGDIDKGLSIYDKYRPKGKQKFKTEEQKEAIRKEWHDRKATRKYGESVLGIMSGISDVPTWQLEKALRGGDMEAILASAKALKGIGKQLSSLEYIDDGIAAAKKYSMNDVVKANDAVKKKLADIGTFPLQKQVDKLEFEIKYVADPAAYKPGAVQYPTWPLSQMAYVKQLNAVHYKITVNDISDKLKPVGVWLKGHPKIKKLAGLVDDLESLIDSNAGIGEINSKFAEVTKEYNAKLKAESRARKTAKASKTGGVVQFDESCFTQARKDAAVWDTAEAAMAAGRKQGQLADDTLFDPASAAWKEAIAREKRAKTIIRDYEGGAISRAEFEARLKAEGLKVYTYDDHGMTRYMTEREAIYEYTHHYCDVNEPLEGRRYCSSQRPDRFYAKVNAMTDIIDTCETPADMWFQRGDSGLGAIFSRLEFAGVNVPQSVRGKAMSGFTDELVDSLQQFVGETMQEGGFMSMGSAKHKGFDEDWGKDVIINIYAPKGTRAMYAEHFSQFGNGVKSASWTGDRASKSFSKEFETLAQRGTKMRITKIERGTYHGKSILYFDVEIVAQEARDLSYVLTSNIGW